MMWVNGHEQSSIPLTDRGLTLGDGFFTTMQIRHGRPLLWDLHRARLMATAEQLQFAPLDLDGLYQRLLMQLSGVAEGCAKIILTRGSGARGYGIRDCQQPSEIITLHDYPEHYRHWQQTGIPLTICQGRLGDTPLLAGLKTLNRLEQVLLKAELEARGELEGLVLDRAENIVEAVTANVFWRQDSVVYTPALPACGVAGVMRAWILRQLQQWGIVCHQVQTGLAALKTADELFLSNALMEVVPVTGIEDVTYQDHSLARQLKTAFTQTAEAS